ncbi:hypothetical protein WMY93_031613 [Mugilogobius chulae]|uniref:Uncharacterized protein n=1 Tax=Mugilogobius chulae TaxID=88201 RepID=A0AAW0MFJ9_9GOBI
MPYLAHTAHAQLGALPLGFVGWTLVAVSVGLIQWRVWILTHSPESIAFPPEFKLPQSPEEQRVGGAVWAGLVGVALMVVMGIINVFYKLPEQEKGRLQTEEGIDNPAFEFYDVKL